MKSIWAVMAAVALVTLPVARCSKILVLAAIATKSHLNFVGEVAGALGEAAHEVTIFTPHEVKKQNVKWVDSKFNFDDFMPNTFENRRFQSGIIMIRKLPGACSYTLRNFHEAGMNVSDYDLIMIEGFANDCYYPLLKDKLSIILSPNTITGIMHDMIGSVDFPSMVPVMGITLHYPMTFLGRLLNVLASEFTRALTYFYYHPSVLQACIDEEICAEDTEHLFYYTTNTSLVFINSVRSLEIPARPYVPAVVSVGGLNCREPKALPQDLSAWIESSGEAGVIYFSLGTVVKISDLPENHREILLKVFGSLPQKVLWKSNIEYMDNLPANVKLSKWLPQQDILGHAKVRLFITHGGLFSTTEATYHGVPVLGFPVFADQTTNIQKVMMEGWGDTIEWDELTEELLRDKIQYLLNDEKYQIAVKERSNIMKDQPMSSRESVVYWTEYVIRHNGASHLRSPAMNMTWYQLYNFDVYVTMIGVAFIVLFVVAMLFKCMIKTCLRVIIGKKPPKDRSKEE